MKLLRRFWKQYSTFQQQYNSPLIFILLLSALPCIILNANRRTKTGRPGNEATVFFWVFFCEVCGKGVGKGDLDTTGYVYKQLLQKDVQDL